MSATIGLATSSIAAFAPASAASTPTGYSWSGPEAVDPGLQGALFVSCTNGTSFCAAVDAEGNVLTYSTGTWSSPVLVDPNGLPAVIGGISCGGPSFCAVIDEQGDAVVYDGTSWGAPQVADLAGGLVSVSCPSANFCAAVDLFGNAVIYNGSSWSSYSLSPGYSFESVSCANPNFCDALNDNAEVYTFDGSTWSAGTVVNDYYKGTGSISCPTSSFCAASEPSGYVSIYTAESGWATPEDIDPYAGGAGDDLVYSVSCASAVFCMVTDSSGYVINYNNGDWGQPVKLDDAAIYHVSCASAELCLADDQNGDVLTWGASHAPVITSAPSATFQTGLYGVAPITTSASPAATISVEGGLPPGLSLGSDPPVSEFAIVGLPAAGSGGSYSLTITASNGIMPDAIQDFTLTVFQSPTITSSGNVAGRAATPFDFSVTTTGYPWPAALSESGAMPPGLSFTDNGDGTATIAGTPTLGGVYPLSVTASSGVAPNANQLLIITIAQAPAFTNPPNVSGTVGEPFSFEVATSGYPVPNLSGKGKLPPGLRPQAVGNGDALVSGTPTKAGTYVVTVHAANGIAPAATQTLVMTVAAT